FEKIKLIRRTEKGEVWLANDKSGNFVIFKQINFVGLPYKILKNNLHELWAKIFFCVEDDNKTFVVEEFFSGENLSAKNLTESQAKNFILQLCDGLKILHNLGIVHRDIKPSNLILQGDKIKLIDFDAARIFSADKSEDTNFLGTKGYAPPEQFGYGQTDSRSDIFSLGKTFQKLLGKNCKGNLKKILSKCTELDPANRFQTVDELKFALLEKNTPTFPTLDLTKIFLLSFILIFLLHSSTAEEKISAPVEVEKVIEQKNIPEKISVVKESYKFPEIKIPETEQKNIDVPKKIAETPQENVVEKIPEKIYKDYVRVKYFFNGKRIDGWTDNFEKDIENAGWAMEIKNLDNFQKVGENFKFPAWNFVVKVENLTEKNFLNPQVEIIYNDGGRIEKKILQGATIAAGGEINFKIPLNQFLITKPAKQKFQFNFSGSGAKIHGSMFRCNFNFKL
ncbi:MAG: serine/threonine protein kinase, partial [Selenomonadaceae bacterium]|nr:serine/threonine protein kinase [Selenomonadaceae bacterium]